jgi:hypothetical protein
MDKIVFFSFSSCKDKELTIQFVYQLSPSSSHDVDALGWCVPMSQPMVGAKAAQHHGCGGTGKIISAQGGKKTWYDCT